MKRSHIRRTTQGAVFCALTFVATCLAIPLPLGNINLGDGMLLLCVWSLGGVWGVLAGAVGAALADLVCGFAVYAPATFLIKLSMALLALCILRLSRTERSVRLLRLLSAVCAELVMVGGYFLYESVFLSYGLSASVNIPFNLVQGGVAVLMSITTFELLPRTRDLRF